MAIVLHIGFLLFKILMGSYYANRKHFNDFKPFIIASVKARNTCQFSQLCCYDFCHLAKGGVPAMRVGNENVSNLDLPLQLVPEKMLFSMGCLLSI